MYYVFINPKRDWKKIIKGQLSDLFLSGLLLESKLCIHITDTHGLVDECMSFINDLIKSEISFKTNDSNQWEYPGFKWLYELAQEYPDSAMLYLHTKGMVYHYLNDRDMCEKTILRYSIDNYKNTLKIFDENKLINKIGVYPSTEGWLWFNFFWIRSDYLMECNPPEYKPDNRYYYESYIGREAPKVNKSYKDCYSLLDQTICGYSQPQIFGAIYDHTIYNYDMKRLPGGQEVNVKFNKMEYTFLYGTEKNSVDVTELVYTKCVSNDIVIIPADDISRAKIFGDPIWGSHKYLFIKDPFGTTRCYEPVSTIYIDLYFNKLYVCDELPDTVKKENVHALLKDVHAKLKIKYVNFTSDEYPEQCMSMRYIKGPEKVLEIGANVGRNTLVISKLLDDSANLVSLECDTVSYNKLLENKELNSLKFNAENSALSARKLIQKSWDTMPSEILLDGYTSVNTITLPELKEKYPLSFDTLVLDCEGAFYYILMDYPEILDGIKLIIMENDYHDITHKEYLDSVLKSKDFRCDYTEGGGWGPCEKNFYEVWTRG